MILTVKRLKTTLGRVVRLLCPICGEASIVQNAFRVRHHCINCDALFQREEGFFVGAILANVLVTEMLILATYMSWLLLVDGRESLMLGILFSQALLFPLVFYHYSWSIWLGFNSLTEGLPKYSPRERI